MLIQEGLRFLSGLVFSLGIGVSFLKERKKRKEGKSFALKTIHKNDFAQKVLDTDFVFLSVKHRINI